MDIKDLDSIRKNQKIVFTNGCFDLLHVGHTRYLSDAKALGDFLVIGLNSDASVKRLKGEKRPIQDQNDRKEILLSLKFVDAVFIFEEDTPLNLIQEVKPQVLVKGGDWPIEKIVGFDFVTSQGGEVRSLGFSEGKSTSHLLQLMED